MLFNHEHGSKCKSNVKVRIWPPSESGWLVEGGDVPLGRDGAEPEDDVDAEEDGDAVVAVRHVGGHAFLQEEAEGTFYVMWDSSCLLPWGL